MNPPKTDAEIVAAIKVYKTVTAAADALGIAPSTIHDRRKKSVEISTAILEARMGLVDKAEGALEKLIDLGDFRAVNLALRTLGKDRGYVERVETVTMTDEQLDAEIAKERAQSAVAPSPDEQPVP